MSWVTYTCHIYFLVTYAHHIYWGRIRGGDLVGECPNQVDPCLDQGVQAAYVNFQPTLCEFPHKHGRFWDCRVRCGDSQLDKVTGSYFLSHSAPPSHTHTFPPRHPGWHTCFSLITALRSRLGWEGKSDWSKVIETFRWVFVFLFEAENHTSLPISKM